MVFCRNVICLVRLIQLVRNAQDITAFLSIFSSYCPDSNYMGSAEYATCFNVFMLTIRSSLIPFYPISSLIFITPLICLSIPTSHHSCPNHSILSYMRFFSSHNMNISPHTISFHLSTTSATFKLCLTYSSFILS